MVKAGILNPSKIKSARPGYNILATSEISMGIILVPLTTSIEAEGAREMTVQKTVMAGKLGLRVWSSIIYSKALLNIMILPAMVRVGSAVMREIVLLTPTISIDNKSM